MGTSYNRRDKSWVEEPRPLPGLLGGLLIAGTFLALFVLELRRPLRRAVESKPRRTGRNLAVAALSALAVRVVESPVTTPLTRYVQRRRIGLVHWLRLPPLLGLVASVILLDYTLYLWHVLTHKVRFLWRFHQVHHADLDMDASTALRFHFGEISLSTAWRAAQILAIGVSPAALSVWSTLVLVAILFHHSNVELPLWLERRLARLLITPRLHGIHHSMVPSEMDSNWSSGLSVWDRLHGTYRGDLSQRQLVIGTAPFRSEADVRLGRIIPLPFEELRDRNRLPGGTSPIPAIGGFEVIP